MKIKPSQNGKITLSFTVTGKSCLSPKVWTPLICLLRLFANIKFSWKFLNLQNSDFSNQIDHWKIAKTYCRNYRVSAFSREVLEGKLMGCSVFILRHSLQNKSALKEKYQFIKSLSSETCCICGNSSLSITTFLCCGLMAPVTKPHYITIVGYRKTSKHYRYVPSWYKRSSTPFQFYMTEKLYKKMFFLQP